mmetsp:Transcript_39302/g.73741  ORF Transcript_39302/g.73741 Transcript_39302/m.73741 type:complete len:385 (-) Transcript_39302:2291-3445(-)
MVLCRGFQDGGPESDCGGHPHASRGDLRHGQHRGGDPRHSRLPALRAPDGRSALVGRVRAQLRVVCGEEPDQPQDLQDPGGYGAVPFGVQGDALLHGPQHHASRALPLGQRSPGAAQDRAGLAVPEQRRGRAQCEGDVRARGGERGVRRHAAAAEAALRHAPDRSHGLRPDGGGRRRNMHPQRHHPALVLGRRQGQRRRLQHLVLGAQVGRVLPGRVRAVPAAHELLRVCDSGGLHALVARQPRGAWGRLPLLRDVLHLRGHRVQGGAHLQQGAASAGGLDPRQHGADQHHQPHQVLRRVRLRVVRRARRGERRVPVLHGQRVQPDHLRAGLQLRHARLPDSARALGHAAVGRAEVLLLPQRRHGRAQRASHVRERALQPGGGC